MSQIIACKELLASLSEYIDGALSENLCTELEHHLATCENCRVVLNTTRKTIELYHGEEKQPLPEDIRSRLFCCLNLEDYLVQDRAGREDSEKANPGL